MSDKNNSNQAHYPDPSLIYNDTWLVKNTLIGGIMFALGSYYLPLISSNSSLIWFWDILIGQQGSVLNIMGLAIVLFPLLMLKFLPRNVLAISLISFLSFVIITNLLPELASNIQSLTIITISVTPTSLSITLIIYLILAIFILSTLCKALQDQHYPVILLRLASAFLLILLTLALVTAPINNYPGQHGLDSTLHEKLFTYIAIAYALSGLSQSFRQAPAAIVKILFFALIAISLIGSYFVSDYLSSNSGAAGISNTSYLFLRAFILVGGTLILLRCSIVMSCIQYTERRS